MFVYRVDMGEPGDRYVPGFFGDYGAALRHAREINDNFGESSSVVEIGIHDEVELALFLNNLVSNLSEES